MTHTPVSRRTFLQAAGAAALSGLARAGQPASRKMTIDLVCGNIGVKADLPTAVALAHRHGFESLAPDANHLAAMPDGRLAEFLADLKAKGLTWGAAGLPVDFRGEEEGFRAGMAKLPEFAAALQ